MQTQNTKVGPIQYFLFLHKYIVVIILVLLQRSQINKTRHILIIKPMQQFCLFFICSYIKQVRHNQQDTFLMVICIYKQRYFNACMNVINIICLQTLLTGLLVGYKLYIIDKSLEKYSKLVWLYRLQTIEDPIFYSKHKFSNKILM